MVDRTRREFSDDEIARIASTYHRWRNKPEINVAAGLDPYADQKGFSRSVPLDEVRSHGFVLTPGRYVGSEDVEDDGIGFEERFGALRAKLAEQFAEGRELEARIEAAFVEAATDV